MSVVGVVAPTLPRASTSAFLRFWRNDWIELRIGRVGLLSTWDHSTRMTALVTMMTGPSPTWDCSGQRQDAQSRDDEPHREPTWAARARTVW